MKIRTVLPLRPSSRISMATGIISTLVDLVDIMNGQSIRLWGISYRLKRTNQAGNMTTLAGGGFVKMDLTLLQNLKQSTVTGSISMIMAICMLTNGYITQMAIGIGSIRTDTWPIVAGRKSMANGTTSMQTVPCRLAG